jgi:uncharacterized protein YqgC (DUF456 family)
MKKKLIDEIKKFRKGKPFIAIPLIIIGILGLVLPIIPGILLIVTGLTFLYPSFFKERIWKKSNN